MRAHFLVYDDDIGSGLSKVFDVLFRVGNHQVCFKWEPGAAADCFNDQRSHGDVGDKVTVHDINLDTMRSRRLCFAYLLAEPGEVGGED